VVGNIGTRRKQVVIERLESSEAVRKRIDSIERIERPPALASAGGGRDGVSARGGR
jgi:hypothetical protein